jgi:hypothetical protein
VLVYALLLRLIEAGVPVGIMRDLDLQLVDVNPSALSYVKRQFGEINAALGERILKPSLECNDFLSYNGLSSDRALVIFGNPPFVSNPKGGAWKNVYAEFVDRCLEEASPLSSIHLILPLSIAFSRDYALLRKKLRLGRYTVFASHFDNMPDTLFKSGKPRSDNTNKANSQRCTILSAVSGSAHRLYSSSLQRWSASHRAAFLAGRPEFHDVTNYNLSEQFIRPASQEIAVYLQDQKFTRRLGDLVDGTGDYVLRVGGVARNYIAVREGAGKGVHSFYFRGRDAFYLFLGIVASDVFYQYWRTVGDGFHLTRSSILEFPISTSLLSWARARQPIVESVWVNRLEFAKKKINSGTEIYSYDFSAKMPNLLDLIL